MMKVALSRKPPHVPAGKQVPKLSARLDGVRLGRHAQADGLQRYRALTGWTRPEVPPVWPFVLASGLHLELLAGDAFPVKLLGIVHVAQRLEVRAPLQESDEGALEIWLEGHRDTERGQEFDLHTVFRQGSATPWVSLTTFLARAKSSGGAKKAPPAPRVASEGARWVQLDAPSGLGRRYGDLVGDLNPIHLSDLSAKLFGFPKAIAHGMWSLARCLSEQPPRSGPWALDCQFKLPVFMPSRPWLESTSQGFTLLDEGKQKPHLAATWSTLS